MNRDNLAELMVVATVAAALCGCASAPLARSTPDTQQATGDPSVARNTWRQCIRAAILRLDDPHSASDLVARAAMKSCSAEYADMTRSLAQTRSATCGRDTACIRDALAKAQREATQVATDDVLTARVRTAGERSLKCQ